MNRAVFLDRDGVLNEATIRGGRPYPPNSVDEVKLLPGTDLLCLLKDAGFLLIVTTNQPDVARGTQTREAVEAINAALRAALPLDDVLVCWHDDSASCQCRKPKPGLFLDAAAAWEIDLKLSFMIGDRWRDIDGGAAAGCKTVLIDRRYVERAPTSQPDHRAGSLADAINWILQSAPAP